MTAIPLVSWIVQLHADSRWLGHVIERFPPIRRPAIESDEPTLELEGSAESR